MADEKPKIDRGVLVVSFLGLFWASSEILSSPPVFIILGSVLLTISSIGLLFLRTWALRLYVAVSIWYLLQNLIFLGSLPFLNFKSEEEPNFILLAAIIRSAVIIYFIGSLVYLNKLKQTERFKL